MPLPVCAAARGDDNPAGDRLPRAASRLAGMTTLRVIVGREPRSGSREDSSCACSQPQTPPARSPLPTNYSQHPPLTYTQSTLGSTASSSLKTDNITLTSRTFCVLDRRYAPASNIQLHYLVRSTFNLLRKATAHFHTVITRLYEQQVGRKYRFMRESVILRKSRYFNVAQWPHTEHLDPK